MESRRAPQMCAMLGLALGVVSAGMATGHELFLAIDNHTDYNWNAPAADYDAAMLSELDFYLDLIDETVGNAPAEQARYLADGWWWLYLYERDRSAGDFADLIAKMKSGHLSVPLNPFVTLYGAMTTEMAIRAGYYPGRIARAHGVEFSLTYASTENSTVPWGLASILAGSGAPYAWKGVCDCTGNDQAPHGQVPEPLFHWHGADDRGVLMKWYRIDGSNQDRGGYAEARNNLSNLAMFAEIGRSQADMPGITATGLFGVGWDDVSHESRALVDAVIAFNAATSSDPTRTAIVSNGVDFFRALEASGEAGDLPVLRGGWGNDWDMWPISLAERTARQRRAIERLRVIEALAVLGQWSDADFWPPLQSQLEVGLTGTWKYFEHGWNRTGGGPSIAQVAVDKESWTQEVEAAVDALDMTAQTATAALFETPPGEDRVAVFNPLGFPRSDVVELEVASAGPYRVIDVATGRDLPSQMAGREGRYWLRWIARDVPALGVRVFRLEADTPPATADVAIVDPQARTIESARYRVALGDRGQIVSVLEKGSQPAVELAGAAALNDWGSGSITAVSAEEVGPVSATLRMDLEAPARSVRITLHRDVDRIEIDNRVHENLSGFNALGFEVALEAPQLHFEELGAIARPGLVAEGGDYLPGTKASRLTLNHFLAFDGADYQVLLSNADAYAMQVGESSRTTFDLGGSAVTVLVTDSPVGAGIAAQGGDDQFRIRFALRAGPGAFSAAEAMRVAMAHQNSLRALRLAPGQSGPLRNPAESFVAIDAPNLVLTAFKPAEEAERGFVLRVWELEGRETDFEIDVSPFAATEAHSTTLIESDREPAGVVNGRIQARVAAHGIAAYRFLPSEPGAPERAATTRNPDDLHVSALVDFDDLVPGTLLSPGDPVAAGVRFGGGPEADRERARVVDLGEGNRALQSVDIGTDFPVQSWIAFTLDDPVSGLGATLGSAETGAGDPRLVANDTQSETLVARTAFPLGDNGFAGVVDPSGLRVAMVGFTTSASANAGVLQLDDLVIDRVPEPEGQLAAAAALVCLSSLCGLRARRRSVLA